MYDAHVFLLLLLVVVLKLHQQIISLCYVTAAPKRSLGIRKRSNVWRNTIVSILHSRRRHSCSYVGNCSHSFGKKICPITIKSPTKSKNELFLCHWFVMMGHEHHQDEAINILCFCFQLCAHTHAYTSKVSGVSAPNLIKDHILFPRLWEMRFALSKPLSGGGLTQSGINL